jgi:hypothetical protein
MSDLSKQNPGVYSGSIKAALRELLVPGLVIIIIAALFFFIGFKCGYDYRGTIRIEHR